VDGKQGSLVLAEYSLDRLGTKPVLRLPTATSGSVSVHNGSVPSELQEKVASLLASESSRKVCNLCLVGQIVGCHCLGGSHDNRRRATVAAC
jgi:hypothetical protein